MAEFTMHYTSLKILNNDDTKLRNVTIEIYDISPPVIWHGCLIKMRLFCDSIFKCIKIICTLFLSFFALFYIDNGY